jgi:hypothetical protein
MKGTLRRQNLCLGTVGAPGASYIFQDAQCHLLWPGHYLGNNILLKKNIILRVAGTAPQAAARSARWGYHGLSSPRAVRTAKIKLIVASRRALCKRIVKFLQRMVVSALHAPAAGARVRGSILQLYLFAAGCFKTVSIIAQCSSTA